MSVTQFNKNSIAKLATDVPYVKRAQQICLDWLSGKTAFSLTTSGSTGAPKKIEVSANQLKASVLATADALSLYRGSRVLICLNIEFIAGFMMLIRSMELDWDVVLIPPSSNPLSEVPEELSFDFTAMVPMQLAEVMGNPHTRARSKKLGKILLGGVGLTPDQEKLFKKLDQEVFMGYGMTETVSHVAIRKISHSEEVEAEYYVTGDVDFGIDPRGCLFFNGAVTDHQLVQTNDLAVLIPGKRSFVLKGRIDQVVNSGGIKIHIDELENQLRPLFQLAGIHNRFFFWKMADKTLGEALILVVEGPDTLKNILYEVISANVERLKKPRKILFTREFLKTGSQKVDKYRTFESLIKL